MNEQYFQTLKSAETEDWLDFHVIRPFCFQLARFFAKFDVNPKAQAAPISSHKAAITMAA